MSNANRTQENLQTAIGMEIAATHQYQLHAHVLEDWGLSGLAADMRSEIAEEMTHADRFIERLIFLGGAPVLTMPQELRPAADLRSLFSADLEDEKGAIRFYTEAARQAEADGDVGSRRLFEDILLEEEGHKAWLELQLSLIERMGEPVYIAQHLGGGSEAGA